MFASPQQPHLCATVGHENLDVKPGKEGVTSYSDRAQPQMELGLDG